MGKIHLEKNEKILKVPSLEELNAELKRYGIILDGNIIQYLSSLINLEVSALRKDILNDEERKMLGEISLYRKITTYNIYHRAIELLEKHKAKYNISILNNNNEYEGIIVSGVTPREDTFSIFDYHYAIEKPYISLYEFTEDQTQREKEMMAILEELNILYEAKSPFITRGKILKWQYNKWKEERNKRIAELEKSFSKLDKRTKMSSEDLFKSEVKQYFAELFENEYGIHPKKDYMDDSKKTYLTDQRSHLVKELRVKYPTLTLKKEVKYY